MSSAARSIGRFAVAVTAAIAVPTLVVASIILTMGPAGIRLVTNPLAQFGLLVLSIVVGVVIAR